LELVAEHRQRNVELQALVMRLALPDLDDGMVADRLGYHRAVDDEGRRERAQVSEEHRPGERRHTEVSGVAAWDRKEVDRIVAVRLSRHVDERWLDIHAEI